MTHSLTLGSLLLTDSMPDAEHDFVFNVLADGMSFGAGSVVEEVVRSLLADGDLTRITRYGNREVTFSVEISGPSLASLARGEAALRREVGRTNTLIWQAPDYFAVPTAFEVITSRMSQTFDDLAELRSKRTFTLTLTCAPFARSAELTTITALEVGASESTTSIDTCDSAAGWTGSVDGASAAVSTTWQAGAVSVVELIDPAPQYLALTRTGSINFSANRYLVAEVGYNASFGPVPISATSGGKELAKLEQRLISPGWYRCVYDTKGATLSAVTFTGYFSMEFADLKIRQVSSANRPPAQSSRQPSRIIDVGGTERTPGSLRISAPNGTTPLGLTLAATWPEDGSGFSPPLRQQWRAGGNTEITAAGTFSGKREPLGPAYSFFDVPVESLPPGTYQLMALMSSSVTGIYPIESFIQSRTNDDVVLGETTWGADGTETTNFPVANDWKLVPMGVFGVPIAAAKAGKFRVHIKTPGHTVVDYDEAWLFPVGEDCALTAVLAREPHLWLDSADVDTRVPHVWEGASADKSDAHFPAYGVHTMGQHIFTTDRTAVFTATRGVEWPTVTLSYHKRWHSNAAED